MFCFLLFFFLTLKNGKPQRGFHYSPVCDRAHYGAWNVGTSLSVTSKSPHLSYRQNEEAGIFWWDQEWPKYYTEHCRFKFDHVNQVICFTVCNSQNGT